MNKETLYQIIQEDKLLFVARGNPFKNPSLDIAGGTKARAALIAPAIQVHQFEVYFDAACSSIELCIDPEAHRASYAYKQINALEKRAVCDACEALRRDYLATRGEQPPTKVYDYSDKR